MEDNTYLNLISGNAEKSIENIVNNNVSKNWTSIFIDFYDKFVKNNKLLFMWLLIVSIFLIYKYNSAKKKHKKHKKHKKNKSSEKVSEKNNK